MRWILPLSLAVVLAAASCTDEAAAPATSTPEPCRMPVEAPAGYQRVAAEEVEQGPTVGVRTFYSAPQGRHLVYTAGVLMDFFEDPPDTKLTLRDGGAAWLFGGSTKKWILFWYQDDSCKQYSIGGQGFSRAEFLDQMRELEMLPAR